jgi:hypothetical protein
MDKTTQLTSCSSHYPKDYQADSKAGFLMELPKGVKEHYKKRLYRLSLQKIPLAKTL